MAKMDLISRRIIRSPFIGKIVIGFVSAVVAAAGIVLLAFSGGSSAAGISLAVSGAVATATDIAFTIGDTIVNHVTLSNMYGPDGYDIHVRGDDLIGSYDPATGKFTVTGFHPLLVEWVNNTSHSNGVVTA
jgi:hypothetical protein